VCAGPEIIGGRKRAPTISLLCHAGRSVGHLQWAHAWVRLLGAATRACCSFPFLSPPSTNTLHISRLEGGTRPCLKSTRRRVSCEKPRGRRSPFPQVYSTYSRDQHVGRSRNCWLTRAASPPPSPRGGCRCAVGGPTRPTVDPERSLIFWAAIVELATMLTVSSTWPMREAFRVSSPTRDDAFALNAARKRARGAIWVSAVAL